MLEYSHQTYKLTGHSTLADLVCLHTTQKWQGIKSTLLNSRRTTNLPSLPHMRISLSLWQQSFQSLGTSRIKSNIFWFQLVVLSASCLFLSFVFSARKKIFIQNQIDNKKNISFSEKKQSPNRKSDNWSGLHRKTTPQDPSPILSNFWYFSRGFASSSEKTIQVEKTSWKNFEIWGSYHWRTSAKSTHWFWTQAL